MRVSVFILIFAAVILSSTLAAPNEDPDAQESIRHGILRYLLRGKIISTFASFQKVPENINNITPLNA